MYNDIYILYIYIYIYIYIDAEAETRFQGPIVGVRTCIYLNICALLLLWLRTFGTNLRAKCVRCTTVSSRIPNNQPQPARDIVGRTTHAFPSSNVRDESDFRNAH